MLDSLVSLDMSISLPLISIESLEHKNLFDYMTPSIIGCKILYWMQPNCPPFLYSISLIRFILNIRFLSLDSGW